MTFYEVIQAIERVAARYPSIQMIVRQDVTRLNEVADARYGVFSWQTESSNGSTTSGVDTYNFVLFYADRLTGGMNDLEMVQSVGYSTLNAILNDLGDEGVGVGAYTFTPFEHRFADDCGGVWCRCSLFVPRALCGVGADFSDKTIKIV